MKNMIFCFYVHTSSHNIAQTLGLAINCFSDVDAVCLQMWVSQQEHKLKTYAVIIAVIINLKQSVISDSKKYR